MREIWGYCRWQWQNFEGWQKMFIFAMFLQGLGWTLGGQWGPWVAVAGAVIILAYIVKWLIIDNIKQSWAKYKQHRNELLTTIKQSHER